MNIDNITKGVYAISKEPFSLLVTAKNEHKTISICMVTGCKEQEQNAEFILESLNVSKECGLSPAELLENRDLWMNSLETANKQHEEISQGLTKMLKLNKELEEANTQLLQQKKELMEALNTIYTLTHGEKRAGFSFLHDIARATLSKHPNK